jgi:hypothetical protein
MIGENIDMKKHMQQLKETLASMPPKKKLEHLWTYYKWVPILLLALIFFASSMISSILESRKTILFGGICINVTLSQDTQTYLTEDLFAHFGGTDHSKEKVILNHSQMTFDSQDPYGAYAESTAIAAQIAAREIDYILMDTTAKDYFTGPEITTDLSQLLTPQQLNSLQRRLIYRKTPTGERYPFAIDLTDTPFAAACGMEKKGLYVAFPGNTDRVQRTADFLEYLLNWK